MADFRQWASFVRRRAFFVLALLPACGEQNDDGGSPDCALICSRLQACGSVPDDCLPRCTEELDDTSRILQIEAGQQFRRCVSGVAQTLHQLSCAELEDGAPNDCFDDAVTLDGCVDPGWGAFAEGTCGLSDCPDEQRAQCVETVLAIGADLPCLNEAGLSDAVSCDFSCSTSTSGGITQTSTHLECTHPGGGGGDEPVNDPLEDQTSAPMPLGH